MKENKNIVFALQSFNKTENGEYEKNGFLLFPDEAKAMDFLQTCNDMNRITKMCHYEKLTWAKVSDYIGERVNQQKQFYVKEVEMYSPTEEDFMPSKVVPSPKLENSTQ